MHTVGFDHDKYLELQGKHIQERRDQFGGKLYLEFGGKLFDDHHASRVLPGFTPDNKIKMLETLKDEVEVVIVVSAKDLSSGKVRADLGIPYDEDVLRLVDAFRNYGLFVGSIVISHMTEDNREAKAFKRKLEKLGLKVYRHFPIKGYPHDVAHIISDQGYGKNEYVETSRDLVVVTAPGPGSGKMATCLSQLYHDHHRGVKSGYAKFETFPIWNLPLEHPVNIAYEAATVDLDDVNMIDPWHLAAYGEQCVNYNRDVEVFPVLERLYTQLQGSSPYKSPTDMGVNMAGHCISNDEACREAAKQEIIRRYYKALVHEAKEALEPVESARAALIMSRVGVDKEHRPTVVPTLELAKKTKAPTAAIELQDGTIITGKTTELLGACSAMLLNALKHIAGIDQRFDLLAHDVIAPIKELKVRHLGSKNPRLHTDEVLLSLATSATSNPVAKAALEALPELRGCDVHTSVILGPVDERIFRSLGIHVTSEPIYQSKSLYRKR
ncbi:MAG: DUF1846 domain-containing protein [Propionibacteriaceae bacterium]